ncbi:MAG: DNA methyltransferase, partial [Bacteroidota bacterium]
MALVIAKFQCDVIHLGQQEARLIFLPLEQDNWITHGNALRLDWLSICPPTGTGVKLHADDLFSTPLEQPEIDFENEGGETYICGNPPYRGSQWQTISQKQDIKEIFKGITKTWGSLDYVSGWFMKAASYGLHTDSTAAFVSTNSICQGRQVENLWSLLFAAGQQITFAHTSFKWANLASHNAGVTVVIIGISANASKVRKLFSTNEHSDEMLKEVTNINAYLAAAPNVVVKKSSVPLSDVGMMSFGNMANDGGSLILDMIEATEAVNEFNVNSSYIRPFLGSREYIRGIERRCIWILENDYKEALDNRWLTERFEAVKQKRNKSKRKTTKQLAEVPFRFGE